MSPLKGQIQPDHFPRNKYALQVTGMIPVVFHSISGLEEEIDVVDLPDRTRASGGNAKAFEFTARQPMHHIAEVLAMRVWFNENKDPISSTAKKMATLVMESGTGQRQQSFTLLGLWPSKEVLPELSFEDEGEMAEIEWTFQCDEKIPI